MQLNTVRVEVRRLTVDDLGPLLALRIANREYLRPFEPATPDSHYTVEGQRHILQVIQTDWEHDRGFGFGIWLRHEDRLIGRINLSNVVRGAWQNATLGYFLDQRYQGRGLMTEAVGLVLAFGFGVAMLHRIQAAVMPGNRGSIRVLQKAGFHQDGWADHYLKINGVWENHNLYSITWERWSRRDGSQAD